MKKNINKRSNKNKNILIIGDTHSPYNHPDTLPFLRKLKQKYKFDRVIHIGDELDFHASSFHDSDPDLLSAGDELEEGRKFLKKLEKMFPKMDLVESNHGSMAYRRALSSGLSKELMKKYRDVVFPNGGGEGWERHDSIRLTMSNGEDCFFVHQAEANIVNNASHYGVSMIAGHRHSKADIGYASSPYGLRFGMHVGCLIDSKSLAFAYNKLQSKRPILSTGIIIDGKPFIQPMFLNEDGRWTGKL